MKQGQLFIVSAPSGAGKTSLLKALCLQLNYVQVSVSHTTRAPRPGEQTGIHYHFVSQNEFKAAIVQGEFLEYAQVFDHYYGTSRQTVNALLNTGIDVILEIDWQGARQVREQTNAISIFILPPSIEALAQRLHDRQQDAEAVIQRRMRDACREMSHYPEYDYLIINDNFDDALDNLLAIFNSFRLQRERQLQHHRTLLANLAEHCADKKN